MVPVGLVFTFPGLILPYRYAANKEAVVAGLHAMGIAAHEYAPPMGAFYMYVDLAAHGVTDSVGLCEALLEDAGIAMTPGVDFEEPGSNLGESRVRISFPGGTDEVREAMAVFGRWWASPAGLKFRGQ